jgi:hypothetical protein
MYSLNTRAATGSMVNTTSRIVFAYLPLTFQPCVVLNIIVRTLRWPIDGLEAAHDFVPASKAIVISLRRQGGDK